MISYLKYHVLTRTVCPSIQRDGESDVFNINCSWSVIWSIKFSPERFVHPYNGTVNQTYSTLTVHDQFSFSPKLNGESDIFNVNCSWSVTWSIMFSPERFVHPYNRAVSQTYSVFSYLKCSVLTRTVCQSVQRDQHSMFSYAFLQWSARLSLPVTTFSLLTFVCSFRGHRRFSSSRYSLMKTR